MSRPVFTRFLYNYIPAAFWIVFTGAGLLVLFLFFDITPKVGADFFFSSDNPKFLYNKLISSIFPQESSQLIISATGDIQSEPYYTNIWELTEELLKIKQVTTVKSLSKGPKDVEDALESPLWKRLLISQQQDSSNLLVFLTNADPQDIIPQFEELIRKHSQPGFRLNIAGLPYVVEMIRRNLMHDFKIFTFVAFIMFGIVIMIIFRSVTVFIGTFLSCSSACVLTLLCTNMLGIETGIITVNLATIVFVLTLSHIIFITHNWSNASEGNKSAAFSAISVTLNASFWCMLTTLLGFLSLVFVPAKPLRQLGVSGSIGTIMAIFTAYCMYPFFLNLTQPKQGVKEETTLNPAICGVFNSAKWIVTALIIMALCAVPALSFLNDDPSLFSYFKEGSELRKGLEYIDSNGGSSPLSLMIRDAQGNKLNNKKSYEQLWKLMDAIENDPNVESVISLPVIMAEGNRAPLSFLLTWENLLKIMEKPLFNKISNSFVTGDRISGHFFLRMKESVRNKSRTEVVDHLVNIVSENGFLTEIVGGLYYLQGEMSKMVTSSLIYGLGRLLVMFGIIAFMVSRSVIVTFAMVITLCITPLIMFGVVGYFAIPVDIISAPAANVAIAMGIDSMIHMAITARRKYGSSANAWQETQRELWKPILNSMVIICAGFGIFSLSSFPPTQRFGMLIFLGTIVAAISALFVLPMCTETANKLRKK
ncbi:MAG: hypothetical protein C4541_07625 [Candidatus Auribacter fodinae]|jgi:predicted RND superfamily exporter protein|uniref:Membrane transport protein MMPL domain-containing protein n=1 Tax=Candidatus Auribacter fodinae TaxID=2093366 RepID=A0A3A4R209_9BACT|nr:MAG: hypothetical protein C4541_07625 [Candidatus Auribacter fodinae]